MSHLMLQLHLRFQSSHALHALGLAAVLLLSACGGGGGGSGGPSPIVTPPPGVTTDPAYTGRWGWRDGGLGADGPRGVAVAPWGTPDLSPSTFESQALQGNSGGFVFSNNPLQQIGAEYAYSLGLTGAGVKVAVVDSHILSTHGDLDDNHLGFYDASASIPLGAADDHGTHVAGIIAAEKNDIGMHGVAYDANIIGISFGSTVNGLLSIDNNKLAASINAAVADGARIFNNSWGSGAFPDRFSAIDDLAVQTAIANAIDQGSVFVWAAGNDYAGNTPLGDENTSQEAKEALEHPGLFGDGFVNVVNLAWNSSSSEWTISNNTSAGLAINYDSQICGVTKHYCISAPGSTINSTIANGSYDSFSGTSMAAPIVSGGLAILFQAFPYVETEDILTLMFTTADDLGTPGVDEVYGHGMINLAAALAPSGSVGIPTSASVSTNTNASIARTSLSAEAPLRDAVMAATSSMVALDDFDRAYVVGSVGLQTPDLFAQASVSSAGAVSVSTAADFAALSSFGSPISATAATTGAQAFTSERLMLPRSSGADGVLELASASADQPIGGPIQEVVFSSVDKDGAGMAEMRYVVSQRGDGWTTSQSVGLIEERGQLFGNVGSGAYGLADRATTLSLGASGTRALADGLVVYGGVGLNQNDVAGAAGSLIEVSDVASASAVIGFRQEGLGAEKAGTFAVQLGQDRILLDGEASIHVPVGRERGGVILVEEVSLTAEALEVLPELEVSYTGKLNQDTHYALSATASEAEAVVSAELRRAF